jgi:predicted protein tyrosine phosphatase
MKITICGISELGLHCEAGVTHVLSILDPAWPDPEAFHDFPPHRREALRFHDVLEPTQGAVPTAAHVARLLAFGDDVMVAGAAAHLLIHCHAGISRSTAAMAMILAQAFPRESEDAIIEKLEAIRPQAWPNSRMIGFADALLGRDGRLTAAVIKLYARRLAMRPHLADVMRGLDREREVDFGLMAQASN